MGEHSPRPASEEPDTPRIPAEESTPTDEGARTPVERPRGWRRWFTRSHALVAVLCAALGFALVIQVRQTHSDEYAMLRQDDLVQLLDEITQRNDQLQSEQAQLILDRNDLASGVDAQEIAERNAQVQAILAGTIPVQGPGIELVVREVGTRLPASTWVNLVEELRNAGAEAIEVGGVRVGVSSAFVDETDGVALDGVRLGSQVTVLAIGDPQTLDVALGIPGGALATFRSQNATPQIDRSDLVEILSVRELTAPSVATPAPDASPTSG